MPKTFEFDSINIIATAITIYNVFIFVPFIIYGVHLFVKHRTNNLIFHRNPFAVVLMNTLVINALLTERIFLLFTKIYHIVEAPSWVIHLLFALTWDAIIYLKLVKVYYVYFQQQYNISIANNVWKQNINPDDNTDDASWYINHKHTFGNITYLIKLAAIPWFFVTCADGFVPSLVDDHWVLDVLHVTTPCIPIGISLSILYKTRLVNDIYKIRNELFVAMLCISISFLVYIAMFLIRHFDQYHIDHSEYNLDRIEYLVYIFVTDGLAFACSILSTIYPVYLIKKSAKEIKVRNDQKYSQTHDHSDLQRLKEILSHYKLFTAFMSYLVSEYCPESLLFLVELIQCKHAFQRRNKYKVNIKNTENKCMIIDFKKNPFDLQKDYKTEKERYFTYLFHDSGSIMTKLPLSPHIIRTQILKKNNLYLQMKDLYEKYLKPISQFEVNVSYSVRDPLIQIFGEQNTNTNKCGEIQESEIFNVMDECAIEIVQLLQFSVSRFLNSDDFGSFSDSDLEHIKHTSNTARANDAVFKDLLNAEKTGIITYYEN